MSGFFGAYRHKPLRDPLDDAEKLAFFDEMSYAKQPLDPDQIRERERIFRDQRTRAEWAEKRKNPKYQTNLDRELQDQCLFIRRGADEDPSVWPEYKRVQALLQKEFGLKFTFELEDIETRICTPYQRMTMYRGLVTLASSEGWKDLTPILHVRFYPEGCTEDELSHFGLAKRETGAFRKILYTLKESVAAARAIFRSGPAQPQAVPQPDEPTDPSTSDEEGEEEEGEDANSSGKGGLAGALFRQEPEALGCNRLRTDC